MAQKLSFELIEGDPQNTSEWTDQGRNQRVAATTATTGGVNFLLHSIPLVDLYDAQGNSAGYSAPTSGRGLQRLNGCLIAPETVLAAASTLDLSISVLRSFGTLGAQITNAGGAITALTVGGSGINTPMPSGQTFVLTNAAGTSQTWTLSAAAALGATTLAVNSQTPTGTNAVGNALVGTVGNQAAFGWLTGGTGTPTLVPNLSLAMPALTGNLQLVAPAGGGIWLPLYPGDAIQLNEQTSTSTVAVPALAVTTLIL
jgi:hypothetical protein